ncbi:Putative pentatricopeptide repeat-containing protein At5g09950 [Linum perenne]
MVLPMSINPWSNIGILSRKRFLITSRSVFTVPLSLSSQGQFSPPTNPLAFKPQTTNPFISLLGQGRASHLELRFRPSSAAASGLHNFDVYESLVSRFRDSTSSIDAERFHLGLFKHGFDGDLFLCNTLINVYVRAGHLHLAQQLFDEMPERNGVTWACLISGYSQNGMPEDACRTFKGMLCEGFWPNRFAVGSCLRACQATGVEGVKFGTQIHGRSFKSPRDQEAVLCNILISMYGSFAEYFDSARRVFDETKIRSSITWNSIISVYSQQGDVVSAFELFSNMQRDDSGFGSNPNEYTFGSLITVACSSQNASSRLLEQILTRVEKSGFLSDLYVGSALVSGFSRSGLFDFSRKTLKQMSARNVVSMNGLMVGLVRHKCGEQATEVFMEMRNFVDINLDSYVILLSAFAEFSTLEEGRKKGREVHGFVTRNGLIDIKVSLGNGLINMYAKCGAIDNARSVFKHMVNKDSVSWNTMISGLDQNECFNEATEQYREMRRTGLMPSNFTIISALSSCASVNWIMLGRQIHGEGLKLGLDIDVSVSNALLALYAETGYLAECHKAFSLMSESDQVSWNTMVGAYAHSETSVFNSVEIFLEMMRDGWKPNRVTFINILAAVSSLSLNKLTPQIHVLLLKHHAANDTAVENALLASYGKCGEMNECEKLFSRMSERKDEVSWNSMISGYIHNEMLSKAMDLVWFMLQRGQQLDCFTFATVLSACASVATLECGMQVHAVALRSCLESDVVIGSALIDMYSKCGRVDYASRFFNVMPMKNLYSWNSMISGYARHGHGEKALDLFSQMKLESQLLPDHVTFVGVLSACSHVGLVDEGFKHFRSMTETYGLVPRIEHYSCMADLLGRAGEFDKMESFITTMPMQPNILIWRTVLGACGRSNGRKTELGKKAAKMLMEMEPNNAVNYVLLANMYASGGKWEDMARSRKAMKDAEVKKEAGCSWVTMKDGVHVFVAGDKSHPEMDSIYEKLKELNRKMKDAGYIPQTRYALYDLDAESKEELLSYHSEKIAVAFVLSRSSGGELPIRIMKNLRVCGDCHYAFKFISKIVGRQIVLRDSNSYQCFDLLENELKDATGYDAAMVYGSHEDDPGEVIAESVKSDLEHILIYTACYRYSEASRFFSRRTKPLSEFLLSDMIIMQQLRQGKFTNFYSLYSKMHPRKLILYCTVYVEQCLKAPREAQYGGGMIAHQKWTASAQRLIASKFPGMSEDANLYALVFNRTHSLDDDSQKVQFLKGNLYVFSGWIQVSKGSQAVGVVFRTNHGELIPGGEVTAKTGCWSLLKGGIFANFSGPAEILFESKNTTTADIWIDNVSLQPFTMEEWRSHQDKTISMERKSKVRFQVKFINGTSTAGAKVTFKQINPEFPFGCGMNYHILHSTGYQEWFASRFKYTTFTNEMKWYSTEKTQGQENYTTADAMLKFAREHEISVRGHNIFWDDPKYQPGWVSNLTSDELKEAAAKRIDSVVSRYAGQLIAWDVMNENLHFSFFEDKLGRNTSSEYFLRAHQLDPNARLFMNEYNTVEFHGDSAADPRKYKNRLEEILSYPGNQDILAGIGVQGHFSYQQPNLAYMRCSLDILASTGIPIWFTEVSIGPGEYQAEYLEQVLREAYSHPGVKGIIMFAGPAAAGFNETSLADKEFKNTAAGDVVDKLICEWESNTAIVESDGEGLLEVSLFHGDYNITVENTDTANSFNYRVSKEAAGVTVHHVHDILLTIISL